ncbi:hypothetical protein D9M69_636090 [compost metagenome]
MAFDGLAPAAAQRLADQALHGRHGLRAGRVRVRVHGHRDVADHHVVVQRDAEVHVVDGFVGCPFALALDLEGVGFGVEQFAFDVPQAVVAFEPPVFDFSGVHGLAGMGRGQWQNRTSANLWVNSDFPRWARSPSRDGRNTFKVMGCVDTAVSPFPFHPDS